MAKENESDIEAAIEDMLKGETSEADKVRRKPRPANAEATVDLDNPGDGPSGPEEPPVVEQDDGIAAELEALRTERDEYKDRFVRALAEAENARKRSDRDRREAENYGGSKLSRDMLPVYDNLKRAVESIGEEQREANAALIEGIELTLRELRNVFEKHGIRVISPTLGEKFDPNHHEAMFEAPVPETKAGDIIQVMAEGFMLHDRLLRAAQVGVSSTPRS
ncbi:nucleotide exchange factor GrpE [Palleronia sp. LCG004]|uniref:nucleotide exchange factor GrpE n=1 Tax=Palleronia sp. LCG004 TaxID=3079304 RepID=UPI002943EE50|nr:nucleotide exchange factor GrpE [Palleronia sp. LCG004]WOI55951.1 nucleotide exchange factor GrpE [Palleronia sp. LCG004]